MNFDFFGIGPDRWQLLLAGALGGVVRWLTLRDHWSDGLIAVVVGGICSVYLSPLAVPSLAPLLLNVGIARDSTNSLSGFLIGIGGITVSGLIMDVWRARRRMIKQKQPDDEGSGP